MRDLSYSNLVSPLNQQSYGLVDELNKMSYVTSIINDNRFNNKNIIRLIKCVSFLENVSITARLNQILIFFLLINLLYYAPQ